MSALISALAAEHGDRQALEIDGKALSYRSIDESAERIAAGMTQLGLAKGDVAGGLLGNCAESVLCFFAAAKIGVIWAPLNVGLIGQDLAYAIKDSRPKLLVVDQENSPKLKASLVASLVNFPLFVTGTGITEGFRSFSELESSPGRAPAIRLDPGDPAVVIYTGGTTARNAH